MKQKLLFTGLMAFLLLISVRGWGQATLPVNAPSLDPIPTGFSNDGTSTYSGGSRKFDTQGDSFSLYYDVEADVLTFDVGVNNSYPGTIPANATFSVEQSVDGASWTNVASYSNQAGGTKTLSSLNSSSRYIRWIYTTKPSGTNIALKNISLTKGSSGPEAPTAFSATANGTDQIDLEWTENAAGNDVLIAWSLDGTFGDPIDGTSYASSASIPGGGTSLGTIADGVFSHTSLSSYTPYYYKIWSVDGDVNYSTGVEANATTFHSEPSNHPSGFTATANSSTAITTSWTDAVVGGQAPSGYLVLANTTGTFTDPVDGTAQTDDEDLSDNVGVKNIAHGSGASYQWATGLSASTQYFFKIYSYNGSGTSINYKTDETVETANATTYAPLVAPTATAATDITTTSFTANWNAVSGATSYRLDVSTDVAFTSGESGNVDEGFDAGTTAPEGWSFISIGGTYTTTSNYGSSSPSLKLDGTGQSIETTSIEGPASSLSFWLKGQTTDAASSLLVEGYDGTSWVIIDNITNSIPTTGTTYTYNSESSPALLAGFIKFRFTYSKSSGNLAFDDVSITYSSTSSLVPGYDNLSATSTSQSIDGLTANNTYYYRVRAYNLTDDETTTNSNTITAHTNKTTETIIANTNFSALENVGAGTVVTVSSNKLIIDEEAEIQSLIVEPGANVDVNTGFGLIVSGDLHLKSPANNNAAASFIDKGTTLVEGNYIIERHLNAYTTDENGWHLLASPFKENLAINGTDFDPVVDDDDFFGWDEVSYTWMNHQLGVPANFVAGKAYLVAYKTAASMRDFTVDGNSFSHLAEDVILLDNASRTNDNGWHLVGNSFLSAVTWDTDNTDWTASNVEASVQVLDVNESGNYLAIGKGETIQALQGFFVRATVDANNKLSLPANARVHSSGIFHKSTIQNNLSLKVNNDINSYYDITKVRLQDGATQNYDAPFDGSKLKGFTTAPQLYTVTPDNKELSVNVVSKDKNEIQIPLHFEARFDATYSISVEDNTLENGITIYLTDLNLNREINLNENPTYSFTASPTDSPDRFLLHFGAVGIGEQDQAATLNAYVFDNRLYVNNSLEKAQLAIYDLQGRLVVQQAINAAGLQSLPLDLPAGIYVLQLSNAQEAQSVKINVQ